MKQQAAADVGGSVAANFGSVVHALAAGVVDGEIANNEVEIAAKLDEHWAALRYSAAWESKVQKTEAIRSIRNFLIWRESRLPELSKTQKAEYSESFFDSDIEFPMPDGNVEKIKLRGSIDILQVQADGQIFIADIKTSTSIASKKDAETNPQLGVYQKAVELGLINLAEVDVAQSLQSAGAALLFVRDKTKSAGPSVRIQSPLAEAETDWMDQNFAVAIEVVRKEIHTPIVSKSCTYCPVKSSCPTQAEGKSVI
jgi:RecB family exonuclease